MSLTRKDWARCVLSLIDLTYLDPEAEDAAIIALCEKAIDSPVSPAGVSVSPRQVLVPVVLWDSGIRAVTVANFPEGRGNASLAAFEVLRIVNDGVKEVDVVFPYAGLAERQARGMRRVRRRLQIRLRGAGEAQGVSRNRGLPQCRRDRRCGEGSDRRRGRFHQDLDLQDRGWRAAGVRLGDARRDQGDRGAVASASMPRAGCGASISRSPTCVWPSG